VAEHRLDRSGWVSTAGHLAPDDYAQPTDIVTRLRTVVATPNGVDIWTLTALEAADEIERLRAAGDALHKQTVEPCRCVFAHDGAVNETCDACAAFFDWEDIRHGRG
jgi:hypothetical protein